MLVNQIAVNLGMFDAHAVPNELNYLRNVEIDESVIFDIVKGIMYRANARKLPEVPTEVFREAIMLKRHLRERIEFHYWNNLSIDISVTCAQHTEKVIESVIHHVRLMYMDIWSLISHWGYPLQNLIRLNKIPNGAILDVQAA